MAEQTSPHATASTSSVRQLRIVPDRDRVAAHTMDGLIVLMAVPALLLTVAEYSGWLVLSSPQWFYGVWALRGVLSVAILVQVVCLAMWSYTLGMRKRRLMWVGSTTGMPAYGRAVGKWVAQMLPALLSGGMVTLLIALMTKDDEGRTAFDRLCGTRTIMMDEAAVGALSASSRHRDGQEHTGAPEPSGTTGTTGATGATEAGMAGASSGGVEPAADDSAFAPPPAGSRFAPGTADGTGPTPTPSSQRVGRRFADPSPDSADAGPPAPNTPDAAQPPAHEAAHSAGQVAGADAQSRAGDSPQSRRDDQPREYVLTISGDRVSRTRNPANSEPHSPSSPSHAAQSGTSDASTSRSGTTATSTSAMDTSGHGTSGPGSSQSGVTAPGGPTPSSPAPSSPSPASADPASVAPRGQSPTNAASSSLAPHTSASPTTGPRPVSLAASGQGLPASGESVPDRLPGAVTDVPCAGGAMAAHQAPAASGTPGASETPAALGVAATDDSALPGKPAQPGTPAQPSTPSQPGESAQPGTAQHTGDAAHQTRIGEPAVVPARVGESQWSFTAPPSALDLAQMGQTIANSGSFGLGLPLSDVNELTDVEKTMGVRPAGSVRLVFDDGTRYDLVGSLLIGRDPVAEGPFADCAVLSVSDQARSVSKAHLVVRVRDQQVFIEDLHSTNGTKLSLADGGLTRVIPGVEMHVTPGVMVIFGRRRMLVSG